MFGPKFSLRCAADCIADYITKPLPARFGITGRHHHTNQLCATLWRVFVSKGPRIRNAAEFARPVAR